MNILKFHKQLIDNYKTYIQSFVNIKDKKYMHMNVACNEQRKKDNGDQAEVTYWCSVYFKESCKMLEHLKKGKRIYASGSCRIFTTVKEGKCYLDISLFAQCFQLL